MPALAEGVYTIAWRVVSRIDGHPTAGVLTFGVGITPGQAEIAAAELDVTPSPPVSEVTGRWRLLAGLVVLLGATCAAPCGFAKARRALPLAAIAWRIAAVGLGLLAHAERRSSGGRLDEFLDTYAGSAIRGRALGLAVVAVAW